MKHTSSAKARLPARPRSARGLARLVSMSLGFATVVSCLAAEYTIDWFTIDGGGGTSTGGIYSLSGAIGQPDAGSMSGGNFTLQGGFWGVVAAVQTEGAPWLSVTRSNAVVLISWPQPAPDWMLEWTAALTNVSNSWTLIPPPYPVSGTNCVLHEPLPIGNKFYRLRKQ